MIKWICAAAGFMLTVLFSKDAMAWGPGVHLATGNFILDHLSLLTPALAELLSANRLSFLYGCLSADIFVGKGVEITPDHCHSWDNGLKLLDRADDDTSLQAYAYGYLCHLAADTVAHNFYVPNLLLGTPSGGKLTHVYVELQADRQSGCCFREAEVIVQLSDPNADACLLNVLERPRLEFSLKKKLFKGTLAMYRFKHWKSSLSFIDRALPLGEHKNYLRDMIELSSSVMLDVLNDPARSVCRGYDPMGFKNLARVKRRRRAGVFTPLARRSRSFFQPCPELLQLLAWLN